MYTDKANGILYIPVNKHSRKALLKFRFVSFIKLYNFTMKISPHCIYSRIHFLFYDSFHSKIKDTYRKGGTTSRRDEVKFQPRKTIFNEQYDWGIHKSYVYDKTAFSYILPMKPDRDYSLILIFAEVYTFLCTLILSKNLDFSLPF